MLEQEIPKTYTPKEWEDKLYAKWEASGFFNPDECIKAGITKADAPTFSMVLPPPNVTGTLHTGSACMLALEDLIIRFHRMRGYRTLWIPGTDHAAIATQSKVERILYETERKSRHDIGRAELLRRIETYAQESHDTIIHQMKKIGSSLDWSREAYTLDDERNFAVRTAFKKMFDDGLIYQGARIVNWDPKLQTTVSDDEIEWKEEQIPFYYLQYGPFVISTARPETKFGDKYVVMHPEDERYAQYTHGQIIEVEWINGSITATIIKDTAIDPAFGTGVMTITPWHDNTDFEIAERHHLDREQIIGEDGRLLPIAGEFAGMLITEAREKIIQKLQTKGLVTKIEENYIHNVATNSRGGGTIEPQIKKQWWIDVNKEFDRNGKKVSVKKLMQDAVRNKSIEILPERFEKVYFHWIDNLRDWCISRQIWFGHRIPVFYCQNNKKQENIKYQISNIKKSNECSHPIVSIEPIEKCPHCGGEIEQDPDTLDTWFSSGLWTFSALGWPNETSDFKTYHPTALLETGYDILFFWVARMILMTTYLLDEVPFKTVYLHGLVRDEQGRKMSKSLDNILDPLDVIDKFGTDALRLSLVIGSTPGNDLRLSDAKIESFRNFANKLWNIGRYIITQGAGSREQGAENGRQEMGGTEARSDADHWILSRLDTVTSEVTRLLENYQLSLAGELLRDFTWNEFADWFVEIHKVEKNDAVLHSVWKTLLTLWHPFMPFVTEAIWETFGYSEKNLLMVEPWPQVKNENARSSFTEIIGLIQEIRAIKSLYRIDPATKLSLTVQKNSQPMIEKNEAIMKRLARIEDIHYSEDLPTHTALAQSETLKVSIELDGIVDFEAEKKRLEKEIADKEKYITTILTKLENKNFIERAKPEIIEAEKKKLAEAKSQLADSTSHLASLNS
ncbi:MAG: valine--tRNA ligase [Candidatus Moraniibacteriota bacterium]